MRKNNRKKRIKKSPWRKFLISAVIVLLFFVYVFYYLEQTSVEVSVPEGLTIENVEKIALEKDIREMVSGYPIEKMVPYIIEKEPRVAAFLISIAKKESNWGKRVPRYEGQDCFNYWGYRGPNRIGSGRHSCFSSREEAVNIVGKRIATLVNKENLDTPSEMIIWKCGSTCSGHSSFGVKKWISDVGYYYKKLQQQF